MDRDKLNEEIANVQEEMAKTAFGTEEYYKLLDTFERLHERLLRDESENTKVYQIELEQQLEKEKLLKEQASETVQSMDETKRSWIKVLNTGIVTLGSIALGLMTIYAEETRAVTSKVWSLVSGSRAKV